MQPTRKNLTWKRLKAAAIGSGFLTLALINPAMAEERLRTLSVTGRGVESIATTETQVRLGVEAQGKTAAEVQQEVARRSNSVVNLLRSRQVDKLETTGINLNPAYRYDNGTQTLTGYTASNIVSFRIATAKAGTLLDDAVKAGASRIDGVSFIAADSAIAAARKIAIGKAIQDAQAQAAAVFSSLNLSQKAIVGIQVDGATALPPRPEASKFADRVAQAAPTPVIGSEQQVEAAVTLQISY
ncbi:MAG TPA: SIMPL domain-containing protein [Thermosynechococcaceae cyanobacterium]